MLAAARELGFTQKSANPCATAEADGQWHLEFRRKSSDGLRHELVFTWNGKRLDGGAYVPAYEKQRESAAASLDVVKAAWEKVVSRAARLVPTMAREVVAAAPSSGSQQHVPTPIQRELASTLVGKPDEVSTAWASAQSIAVPGVKATNVPDAAGDLLSETASAAVSASTNRRTIGAADIDAMLDFEQQKDLLGCSDVACMAEIGGALGVDAMVRVTVGKLGQSYQVSVTLIDMRSNTPLARGTGTFAGDESALISTVSDVVGLVMGEVAQL